MASWYVQTDVGNLFIPDHYNASAATARSMARQWARTFSPDIADEMNVTENPSGFGSVNYGDSVWGGYGVPAGAVNPSNYVQIQDNVTSGKKWDFVETTDVNKGGFSNYSGEGKGTEIQDSLDFADPIAGFLKGLGFNFDQAAGAARDFLQRQGALGAGTFAAQEAANVFGNAGMEGPNQRFDTQQQFGENLKDWGSIGTRALKNLKTLSGLGTEYASPENQQRRYFNPFNSGELDDRGIASQLTAALQGSGVSPLYNRGVSPSDVARMFTTFAGQNPGIANAGEGLDENFLKYASDQLGLSRFFQ